MAYFLRYLDRPIFRKMRKSSILFALSCFFLVLACSKNSDDAPEEESIPIDKSANLLGTGESANDLLSNDKFTKLKIELAHVSGFRPKSAAINNFVDYIREHTFKQNIELIYNELPSPGKETLTLQDIAKLESDNRTVYNEGETLGIYIYFADAPADDDIEEEGLVTLGAVYRNTSMVIHEETIQRFASLSGFITEADVENATINHEFGHLFGLVNLGSDQVNDHEDPEAESHCAVLGCLMRAELQFNASQPTSRSTQTGDLSDLKSACSLSGHSVLKMLEQNTAKGQGVPPDLDSECILDLQANGGR